MHFKIFVKNIDRIVSLFYSKTLNIQVFGGGVRLIEV